MALCVTTDVCDLGQFSRPATRRSLSLVRPYPEVTQLLMFAQVVGLSNRDGVG